MSIDLLTRDVSTPQGEPLCPNEFPSIVAPYRIAFIGEAPGRDEVGALDQQGNSKPRPFVGSSGYLLNSVLSLSGLLRQSVFVGNVCQKRPLDNDIESFEWNGPEIQSGLTQLIKDLAEFKPHLCVLLGNTPLKAMTGFSGITYYRGSLLRSTYGYKCLPTYHPAAILREYSYMQVFALDIRKAAREGRSPELNVPELNLVYSFSKDALFNYIVTLLETIKETKEKISIDIEGYVDNMSCISVSTSPKDSFIIPFTGGDGLSYWSEDEECAIWDLLSTVLADPAIPKVLQNGLYDNFVLSYSYKCFVDGMKDDTMFKHWEAYCELPKNLGFLASIYTDQPPWKDERKNPDLLSFWRYCCTDSAVTNEINDRLEVELDDPKSREHYQFNMKMLHPLLYMELRGLRYDKVLAVQKANKLQAEIDDGMEKLAVLYNNGEQLNVKSPKQKLKFLYETLGLPVKLNRKTGKPTSNDEAILSLYKKTEHPALGVLLSCVRRRTRWSQLQMTQDPDGRVRCSYNQLSGKNDESGGPPTTGRLSCSTSITGSGGNLQTIPEDDRDLFPADPGMLMFQADLSGADGWTVAAHCARLGDPTMLDDLKAGIKVAKMVTGMFVDGPEISRLARPELLTYTEKIPKTHPIYFGSKCCQHGSNFGMGYVLVSQTIFTASDGAVNISAADAKRLQDLYFMRYYGVPLWHRWAAEHLKMYGKLTCASGQTRIFFGRRDDHATLKQFLAHEPQANTTYATNLAALRLWTDPENRWGHWQHDSLKEVSFLNRVSYGKNPDKLIIEPLHQVHDALVGQFPQELSTWAVGKIKQWFNNPLVIAGQTLTIPFDGRYGSSWGTLEHKI